MTVKIKNNLEEIKTQKLHSPPIGAGGRGGGRGIDKFRRDQSNTWKTHSSFGAFCGGGYGPWPG